MAPVPLLMVLYSSDAVEVRYSDGSCLELSPCGSAMIHHDAPRGEHPRQDFTKKIQKRTRFATSEHKHKVLQALDFRNRFADRPYLCDDLLKKEDVLALYAKIDNIAWPKEPEKVKIELQPDGSRRITSLDEFASLVVSPHSHDFTVCYLSRVSEDKNVGKNSRRYQTSRPDSLSTTQSSVNSSSQIRNVSTQKVASEEKCRSKPNEAIVHPFKTREKIISPNKHISENVYTELSQDIQRMTLQNQENQRHGEPHSTNLGTDPVYSKISDTNCDHQLSYHDNTDKPDIAGSQNAVSKVAEVLDGMQGSFSSFNSPRDAQSSQNGCPHSTRQPLHPRRHKQHNPFAMGSPNSHDLSSISRSSTPDGLRTTIDSEATLLYDSIADSSEGKVQVYRQRHSSPTQYTSSPYDAQIDAVPQKPNKSKDRTKENADISFSGSFLGNQKQQSVKSSKDHSCPLNETLTEQSSYASEKSQSSTVLGSSDTMSADSLELQKTLEEHAVLVQQYPTKPSHTNLQSLFPGIDAAVDKLGSNENDMNNSHNENIKAEHQDRVCNAGPEYADDFMTSTNSKSNLTSDNRAPPVHSNKSSELFVLNKEEEVEPESSGKRHRQCYIWTTRHASRNECPVVWSHPLKLALEAMTVTDEDLSTHPTLKRLQEVSTTFKANEKKCTFTAVPAPLPVTCPFQHIHKWTTPGSLNDSLESGCNSNPGEFQHGRLKIVLSEGVIYRLIETGEMRTVEIHPGDGSILISQGVKGHFFTHYVLLGDQLEERTYSLKSLPPGLQKGRYSIEKLIKTANRFMLMNSQWERRGLKEAVPCWKKEIVAVVEPLSSSLLEECHVEGLGKFTAFTNGRVRIVFEDRAALDMVCNFSRRVTDCLQHSQDPQTSLPCASSVSPPVATYDSIFGASSGRLLLPNGKYVTVDIKSPGSYRKYIQAAQEWASWVNATPMERQQFYSQHHLPSVLKQAAEIELKKIFCFNYILEQTMQMQQQHQDNMTSDPAVYNRQPTSLLDTHYPHIASSSSTKLHQSDIHRKDALISHLPVSENVTANNYNKVLDHGKNLRPDLHHHHHYQQHHQQHHQHHLVQSSHSTGHFSSQMEGVVYKPPREPVISKNWVYTMEEKAKRKTDEINQGFQSVRQVLLQNSSLINDIDAFLESGKKT